MFEDKIEQRLAAIEERLAELNDRLTPAKLVVGAHLVPEPDFGSLVATASPRPRAYQVAYRDCEHNGGPPVKTVLIDRDLPPMSCGSVPVLARILSVLEARVSVRQRQGESMADDLIAILKRESE